MRLTTGGTGLGRDAWSDFGGAFRCWNEHHIALWRRDMEREAEAVRKAISRSLICMSLFLTTFSAQSHGQNVALFIGWEVWCV